MGPEVSPSPEPEPIAEEGGASNDKEKKNEQTTDTIDPGTGTDEEDNSKKEASGLTTVIQPKRKKQKVDNCRHKVLELKPPIAERILEPINNIGRQNNVQGQEPLASRLSTEIPANDIESSKKGQKFVWPEDKAQPATYPVYPAALFNKTAMESMKKILHSNKVSAWHQDGKESGKKKIPPYQGYTPGRNTIDFILMVTQKNPFESTVKWVDTFNNSQIPVHNNHALSFIFHEHGRLTTLHDMTGLNVNNARLLIYEVSCA